MLITGRNGISKDFLKIYDSRQTEILWYQETNRLVFNFEKKTIANKSKAMDEESLHFLWKNLNETDCEKVTNINEGERIVASKNFLLEVMLKCFCDGQRIIKCKSKETCRNFNIKHYTSISYKSVKQQSSDVESHQKQPVMTTKERDIIYRFDVFC